LGYGPTFADAMSTLFGEAAKPAAEKPSKSAQAPSEGQPQQAQASPSATPSQTLQQLVNRAIQEFDDYQRLTAQGKYAEAGQKLEQHKRTLEEIRRLAK
jgi:uncharacterized protein